MDTLGLPEEYGQFICSEHFVNSDIENNKLKPGSVPSFLHYQSTKDHDHGYAANNVLGRIIVISENNKGLSKNNVKSPKKDGVV